MEGSNGKLGSNEKIRNLVLIIKKKKNVHCWFYWKTLTLEIFAWKTFWKIFEKL